MTPCELGVEAITSTAAGIALTRDVITAPTRSASIARRTAQGSGEKTVSQDEAEGMRKRERTGHADTETAGGVVAGANGDEARSESQSMVVL